MKHKIVWIIILMFLVSGCNGVINPPDPNPPDPDPPDPEPPVPTIPKISEEIRPLATVQRQGFPTYLFTVFFPEFLYVKEAQLSKQDAIEFWNRVASQDACNGTRVFIGHTSWAGKYEAWIEKPFQQGSNGKYILPNLHKSIEDYINPEWKRLLLERLKILRDREIFRSIDLWDFCQMHNRYNASWDTHWLKQIDDNPQKAFDISSKSFEYVEKFTRYMIRIIWQEEAKHQRPGWNTSLGFNPGNEIPPNKKFHDRICEIVNEEIQKITPEVAMYRWQMIGSALPYTQLPLGIDEKCLYQLHHVADPQTYNELKNLVNINRFMASSDGSKKNGKKFLMPESDAVALIKQIIDNQNFGLELMYGHRQDDKRLPNALNGWKYDLSAIDLTVPCAVVQKYKDSI